MNIKLKSVMNIEVFETFDIYYMLIIGFPRSSTLYWFIVLRLYMYRRIDCVSTGTAFGAVKIRMYRWNLTKHFWRAAKLLNHSPF